MQSWLQSDYVRPYARLFLRMFLTLLVLFILTQTVPFLFSFFLPFILAFIVASIMNPLICLLQKKWNAPRGILSVLMVAVALLLVAAIIGGFVYALAREIVVLAQNIDSVLEYFSQSIMVISYHLYWLLDYMPANAEEIFAGLADSFMAWARAQGTAFADTVITQTVTATARVGGGVVTIIIFVMASYFIMADYPRLVEKFRNLCSTRIYTGYTTLKDAALSALGGYFRAQLLMALVIYLFTLVALLIIRQEFAFLLALLFAIIDFLPIVGTSIILVPWAIVNIISGAAARGIYLLAMSLAAFLLRRMIEPKIVGSQMGLSPLTALASIYIGMQLGGFLGLIFGPIVAMVFVSLYKAGFFDGWITDINAVLSLRKNNNSTNIPEDNRDI